MKDKWMTALAFSALVLCVLICGFIMLKVIFPAMLYSGVDDVITLPASSQSYDFQLEIEDIDLPEMQEIAYYEQAQRMFQEVFGIALTLDQAGGLYYSGNEHDGYTLRLLWVTWDDGGDQATQYMHYEAVFEQQTLISEARLTTLGYWGDAYSTSFNAYVEGAVALFASQLNGAVADNDWPAVDVRYNCEQDDVQVALSWPAYEVNETSEGPIESTSYYATYEHCDLKRGTGQIKSLSMHVMGEGFDPALFSRSERENAIETLRAFGQANQMPLGDLIEQKPWLYYVNKNAMCMTFALEDDAQRGMRFIIGVDGTLFEYEYLLLGS